MQEFKMQMHRTAYAWHRRNPSKHRIFDHVAQSTNLINYTCQLTRHSRACRVQQLHSDLKNRGALDVAGYCIYVCWEDLGGRLLPDEKRNNLSSLLVQTAATRNIYTRGRLIHTCREFSSTRDARRLTVDIHFRKSKEIILNRYLPQRLPFCRPPVSLLSLRPSSFS